MDLGEQYDRIYRYCYMKVQNRQTAEDITQETFLRFLESCSYREMGKQMAYLYTIARNKCIDFYRKRELLPLPEELSPEGDMEEQLVMSAVLREAVQSLPPVEQELIFLRYVNELKVSQISQIVGRSRFAVNRSLKQILGKLRKHLGEEDRI